MTKISFNVKFKYFIIIIIIIIITNIFNKRTDHTAHLIE